MLHGPFVDEQHPTAGSAALSVTFDELFEQHVLRRLEDFVQGQLDAGGPVTQVVVLSNPNPKPKPNPNPNPPNPNPNPNPNPKTNPNPNPNQVRTLLGFTTDPSNVIMDELFQESS